MRCVCRFTEQITPCLVRVSGVKQLWVKVEEMRADAYQRTNQDHEQALMEVWLLN